MMQNAIEMEIKERWKIYFDKLLSGSYIKKFKHTEYLKEVRNCKFIRSFITNMVNNALRMKMGKAIRHNEIPINIWKCLGNAGAGWLTNFFYMIYNNKTPNKWKKSTSILIYKNKGDIQKHTNYHEIKFMGNTKKI